MSETFCPDSVLRSIGERLRAGNLDEAKEICDRALAVNDRVADLQYVRGLIALSAGDLPTAIARLGVAIDLDGSKVLYHYIMGQALARAGNMSGAVESFTRAVEIDPDHVDSLVALAGLLDHLGEHATAIAFRRRLLVLRPDDLQAHLDLARALFDAGNPADACDALEAAVRLAPESAQAWFNLGVAAQALHQYDRAAGAYLQALALAPGHQEAAVSLGVLLHMKGDAAGARAQYELALAREPDNPKALFNLGLALRDLGDDEAADQRFAAAAERDGGVPRALWLLRLPEIVPAEGLPAVRSAFEERLDELARCRLTLEEVASLGTSWFTLAYHGINNRELLAKLCAAFRSACPALEYTAPHCGKPRAPGRLRVGFFSSHLYSHTVGLYFAAFIEALAAESCEVAVFEPMKRDDPVTRRLARLPCAHVVVARHLDVARRQIAEHKLDVLVYPDIGMEPASYFLAFARLAPLQLCLYGHPETTGIDTIDRFLSHAGCEAQGSTDHYRERLLLLPASCTYACFPRPRADASHRQRRDFDLDDDELLLTCAQAPHKIHPAFDGMLSEILAREPRARVLMLGCAGTGLGRRLMARLTPRLGVHCDRLTALPPLDYPDYLAVLRCSDVILDTPHFNGGRTTFEAIAMRRPVVTLPGETLKARQAAHLLGRLGLPQLAAAGPDDYVEKALEIASRPSLGAEIAATIGRQDHAVFDDPQAARAFARLVLESCSR